MKSIRNLFIAVLLIMVGNAYADNLEVPDVNIKTGEYSQIGIALNNPTNNYVAFQFDLELPEGVCIAKRNNGKLIVSLNEDRIDDHTLNVSDLGGNRYRFLSFSMTNAEFYGKSGSLLYVTLQADGNVGDGMKTAYIKSQVFTEAGGNQSQWSDVSFSVSFSAIDIPVIIAENKAREYGEENPTLTYTSSTTLNGKPLLATTATKTSPIGEYSIVVERGTVSGDYTAKNAILTVNKAPLIVKGGSYIMKWGEALPTFTATYEGFKNSETESVLTKKPTLTTTATSSSEPGTYDIIVADADAENYEMNYVKGTLTIIATSSIDSVSMGNQVDAYSLAGNKVLSSARQSRAALPSRLP